MDSLTIEITLRDDGDYNIRVWPKELEEIINTDNGNDEGDDNGGVCTGSLADAVGMAEGMALELIKNTAPTRDCPKGNCGKCIECLKK